MKKGDIYYANLDGAIGSEQAGERPVLIIQNDIGNKYSPTTIVAAITTNEKKVKNIPTHVVLNDDCGLKLKSTVMLEQIRTVDKTRLKLQIGQCDEKTLTQVNEAIKISFFMTDK